MCKSGACIVCQTKNKKKKKQGITRTKIIDSHSGLTPQTIHVKPVISKYG